MIFYCLTNFTDNMITQSSLREQQKVNYMMIVCNLVHFVTSVSIMILILLITLRVTLITTDLFMQTYLKRNRSSTEKTNLLKTCRFLDVFDWVLNLHRDDGLPKQCDSEVIFKIALQYYAIQN